MGFFKTFPIVCRTIRAKAFPDFWMSSAQLTAEIGDKPLSVLGHAASTRRHRAVGGACGEAHEHFWPHPKVQDSIDTSAIVVTGLDGTHRGTVSVLEALGLQTTAHLHAPADATGIAFGRTRARAVRHALLEVLERHLICLAWLSQLPMTRVMQSLSRGVSTSESVRVDTYAATHPALPFAICVIRGNGFMTLGAKLSLSLQQSVMGATGEAVMLHDDQASAENGEAPLLSERHVRVAGMLRDPDIQLLMVERLESNLDRAGGAKCVVSTTEQTSIGAIIRSLSLEHEQFRAMVFPSLLGHCVRVVCPSCKHPAAFRDAPLPIPLL